MSAMSRAICAVSAGSMPNCCSPIRASPESFSRTRPYRADISGRLYLEIWESRNRTAGVIPDRRILRLRRAVFADLEADEARDGDVLAEDPDRVLHHLRDGDVRVANRRLFHEAELLVVGVHLAVDDLVDHLRRLVLHLLLVDLAFAGDDLRRHVLAADVGRVRGRDMHRELLRQLLELVGPGDEVGLAVHLDENADLAAHVDVVADE